MRILSLTCFVLTLTVLSCDDVQTNDQESKTKITVDYITSRNSPDDGRDYNLTAFVDGKEYKLKHHDENPGTFIEIEDIFDFNQYGFSGVLISTATGAAGQHTAVFDFYVYNLDGGEFIHSEFVANTEGDLIKENDNGLFSIVAEVGSPFGTQHSSSRYVLDGFELRKVETSERAKLVAIKEISSDPMKGYEDIDYLYYDLNGDGSVDTIKVSYWGSRSNLSWSVVFSNGTQFSAAASACTRIGILEAKTNDVNDLVCGLDIIYQWDGSEYVEKPRD